MMEHEVKIRAEEIATAGLAAMRARAREMATEANIAPSFELRWLAHATQLIGSHGLGFTVQSRAADQAGA